MKFNFKHVRNGDLGLEYYPEYLPGFLRFELMRGHRWNTWCKTLKDHGKYWEVMGEVNRQRKSVSVDWKVQDLLKWLEENPEYKKYIIVEDQ